MAIKSLPADSTAAGLVGSNVDLITNTTSYADLLKGDKNSDLRSRLWSELVTRDAREKNVFAKFIGAKEAVNQSLKNAILAQADLTR